MQTLVKPPKISKDGGGPLSSRNGSIAAAIFTAVVAGLIILLFLNQYRNGVNKEGVPTSVLVAAQQIEQGTSGETAGAGGLFKTSRVPRDQVKTGAVTDPADLRGEIAANEILPGQQITATDFKAAGHGVVTKLAPDERAITVSFDSAHGLIDNVNVGDHVDVLSGFALDTNGGGQRSVMQILMQNVLVLAVPKKASSGAVGGGGGDGSQVTLRVTSRTAPKLAYAADNGKVWIVLRPQNGSVLDRTTLTSLASLLVDLKPVKAKP